MMPAQPMMQPMGVPHGGVVMANAQRPHARVNPACVKCRGSGWNAYKNKPCGRCVCKKCGGSGWNARKNKACKKWKIKH